MTPLPQHLADAVKKEAERQADLYDVSARESKAFEAGASFLYSIQPESELEKVIKEKDDYIRYLQARIDQLVKNREIVHSENERVTVGYWEQVQACDSKDARIKELITAYEELLKLVGDEYAGLASVEFARNGRTTEPGKVIKGQELRDKIIELKNNL